MADEWRADVPLIDDPATLERMRRILDEESDLIVEHRFYRGARAPKRFVVDDIDALLARLRDASPGDSFYVWKFDDVCSEPNIVVSGKKPDAAGRAPVGGPY